MNQPTTTAASNREESVTIVCSTHDPKMLRSSQRVVWIEDGRKKEEKNAAEFQLDEQEPDTLGQK